MHCTRPCTPYTSPTTSAHCALSFGTLAAVRSTTLRSYPFVSSAEDSPDDDSDLSHTRTATERQKRPDNDSDSGHTRTATRHSKLKPDCCTEGGRIGSRTTSACSFIYFFFILYMHLPIYIISLLDVYTFCVSLLCYYSSFTFINCCMVEMQGMCLRIVYAVSILYFELSLDMTHGTIHNLLVTVTVRVPDASCVLLSITAQV